MAKEKNAGRSGIARAVEASISGKELTGRGILEVIGGVWGIVETVAPGLLFLILFIFFRDVKIAVIAPIALAVIAFLVRVLRKESVMGSLSGLIAVGACVVATLLTGRGEDYFLPGFFINGAWLLGLGISLLIGWPLLGLLLGFLRGDIKGWRESRRLRKAATLVTWLWFALFSVRLAVQLPLYFGAKESGSPELVDALGIARLVMGVPLFAIVVVFTWLLLSKVSEQVAEVAREGDQQ